MNVSLAGFGASGALYGIMFFLIVDRLVAIQKNPDRRRFIIIQLALLVLVPLLFVYSMIFVFSIPVAHPAHFGGALTGFLCGVYVSGWPWHHEHCISRTACQRIALALLSLYFVITLTIFFLKDPPFFSAIGFA